MKDENAWHIETSLYGDSCNFCCGVYDYGGFGADVWKEKGRNSWDREYKDVTFANLTPAQVHKHPFYERVRKSWKQSLDGEMDWGRMANFHFIKEPGARNYQHNVLMELVCELPGCVEVGTFINPGTGNTIRVLSVVPPQKKGKTKHE